MSERSRRADPKPDSTTVNERGWHPWLRVNRLIHQIRRTAWDADVWPVAKVALKRALTERRKLTREGWWN